ncbi:MULTISPECIES: hypothetical protein [Sphingobacterium]|uniref:hypothetical protein n=1 Tax=Sphingobacterium TaxID=28453 RepID=UPI0028B22562|nr:hypothetical protein [Sphingobacterium multivorum]
MNKILKFICQQVFPGFYAVKKNKEINEIYKRQSKFTVVMPNEFSDEKAFKSNLENLIKSQLERKIKLEDKAKSLLFIISLSFTIAIFSISFFKTNEVDLLPSLLALFGICCFAFAGIRVIEAINIRAFHIEEKPFINTDIKKCEYTVHEEIDKNYLVVLVCNKQLNDLICSKIANLTYASFTLIRNGVIFFALFFVSVLLTL